MISSPSFLYPFLLFLYLVNMIEEYHSYVKSPVSLSDFAQARRQNIQTFKINEGDLHHEIHSGYYDGKSGAASIILHVWYLVPHSWQMPKLIGSPFTSVLLPVLPMAMQSLFAVRDFIVKYCDESSHDTQLQYCLLYTSPSPRD